MKRLKMNGVGKISIQIVRREGLGYNRKGQDEEKKTIIIMEKEHVLNDIKESQ